MQANKFSQFLQTIVWCTLSFGATTQIVVAQSEHIEVVTESTPFTVVGSSPGQGGEATLFVESVLERASIPHTTNFIPWKRAYQKALNQENVLVYPIAKTKARENNFHWVGKITPIRYFLFGLSERSDIRLTELEQAKQFALGVVNKHAHHEYLSSRGFDDFELVNSSAQNLRKLLLGRIELFPLSSSGLTPLCVEVRVDCSAIEPKLKLDDFSDGLYMAFSKNTAPEIIERVRQAYLLAQSDPKFKDLFKPRDRDAAEVEQQYQRVLQLN